MTWWGGCWVGVNESRYSAQSEGKLFSAHRGHMPYWQHILGVKGIFWLLSYYVCVWDRVCVPAHLLKPQSLSEIHVREEAFDDARETASFHPFVLKGMWFRSGQTQSGKNISVTLTFISTSHILTGRTCFCRPTDGMSHFWLPLYLKAKSHNIDNIDQGQKQMCFSPQNQSCSWF